MSDTYHLAKPIIDRGEWAVVCSGKAEAFTDRVAAFARYAELCRERNEGRIEDSPDLFRPYDKPRPPGIARARQ